MMLVVLLVFPFSYIVTALYFSFYCFSDNFDATGAEIGEIDKVNE